MGRRTAFAMVLLIVTSVGFAACGDDGGEDAEWRDVRADVESPTVLAGMLTGLGFECTELEEIPSLTPDTVSATCPFGSGDELFLVVYPDAAGVREGIALAEQTVCDGDFGQPGDRLSFVVGPNWTVTTPTADLADEMAGEIGAEVETIVC